MGHDDIRGQPFGKMVGGCRGEVFDRTGRLQASIHSVGHIGANSTAALSLQPCSGRRNGGREALGDVGNSRARGIAPFDGPAYDVMLGVTGDSPQYGILGEVVRAYGRDRPKPHAHDQPVRRPGWRKELHARRHSGDGARCPSAESTTCRNRSRPSSSTTARRWTTRRSSPRWSLRTATTAQVAMLRERYGAEPRALADVLLLVPGRQARRSGRRSTRTSRCAPLQFAAAELQTSHWRFLMGAVGNQATYIRQLNRIMK